MEKIKMLCLEFEKVERRIERLWASFGFVEGRTCARDDGELFVIREIISMDTEEMVADVDFESGDECEIEINWRDCQEQIERELKGVEGF